MMDKTDRTEPYDEEEVVEVEAVEVEAAPADGGRAVQEDSTALEDVPPFLERDARAQQNVEAEDIQADEIEPDTRNTRAPADGNEEASLSLFNDGAAPEYRRRWTDIQARFVDDPKGSVRDADKLVEQVVKHITDTFAQQRTELESHWNSDDRDSEKSTEDLRLAVKRYHTFFDQLLNLKP